jgi:hypothetical protein
MPEKEAITLDDLYTLPRIYLLLCRVYKTRHHLSTPLLVGYSGILTPHLSGQPRWLWTIYTDLSLDANSDSLREDKLVLDRKAVSILKHLPSKLFRAAKTGNQMTMC